MRVFTCNKNFEDMMTCIYDAWEYALTVGHDNVRLMVEPIYQPSLFDEYIHIDKDDDKVTKVVRSIKKSISFDAYMCVYYACLYSEDALDDIYRFLVLGFKLGPGVMNALTEHVVERMLGLRKQIGNEIHHFREFARFNSIDDKVYVCHLEPRSDILYLVAEHFADRMPSEYFMLVDDKRKYAVIHTLDEMYMRSLSEEELETLIETEKYKDSYRELWKIFFDTIGIKERENRKCQRSLMPIWMRTHVVEFMDS